MPPPTPKPPPVNQPRLCRRSYVRKNVAFPPGNMSPPTPKLPPVNQPRLCRRSYLREQVAPSRKATRRNSPRRPLQRAPMDQGTSADPSSDLTEAGYHLGISP